MKTQTKVLILAAIAALAFLGAWLIPEPTLRPLDLASVRGGEPPPCKYIPKQDGCDDIHATCNPYEYDNCPSGTECTRCANDTPFYSLIEGPDPWLLSVPNAVDEVDCGITLMNAFCIRFPSGKPCRCVSIIEGVLPCPMYVQVTAWNPDCAPPE
jgi:hypothetical protein